MFAVTTMAMTVSLPMMNQTRPEPTTLFAERALLASGWARNARVTMRAGRIAEITQDTAPQVGDASVGVLLPGLPNLHSHAHQRGMAGLVEHRGPSADSFWTWRELMYRFCDRMSPEAFEAIAAMAYAEMLEGGFTRVGEFHYLHHDLDGRPYADPAEMSTRVAAAAEQTGIGLTLLPVFYAHDGFGGSAPGHAQRRFIHDVDGFARLLEGAGRAIAPLPGARLGIAPHSLRAVSPDELARITAAVSADAPIHIHIAEQVREVEDCLAWSGERPVQWLLNHQAVDHRWCLVHATHMTAQESRAVAATGAVVGLCPITEANLGDGIFDAPVYVDAGGRWGVGSDSNVQIGAIDELRLLEYSQRLARRERNVMARRVGSTGRMLFDAALAGGAAALTPPLDGAAQPLGLALGASADCVSLRLPAEDVVLPAADDAVLDAWIFGGRIRIDQVWVHGECQVRAGEHVARASITARFEQAMRGLLAP